MRHCVGKSCPALSSELGLMLLTAQVVRGSVGSPNLIMGDRLELDACELELVCTLYLVPSTSEVSAEQLRASTVHLAVTREHLTALDPVGRLIESCHPAARLFDDQLSCCHVPGVQADLPKPIETAASDVTEVESG